MRLLMLAILFLLSCPLVAQLNGKYTFRHINQEDGLLHTKVNSITQDKKGFIWILTSNGMQRYDGYRFVNFPHVKGYSLVNDEKNDRVGVFEFDVLKFPGPSQDSVQTYSLDDLFKNEKKQPRRYKGRNNAEWLIGESGLVLQPGDSISPTYRMIDQYVHDYFFKDPNTGNTLVAFYSDVAIIDSTSGTMQFFQDENAQHPLLRQLRKNFPQGIFLRRAFMDSYESFWMVTWNNYFVRYDFRTDSLFVYQLESIKRKQEPAYKGGSPLLVNEVFEDKQRNIWITTDFAGLLLFRREQNDFDFITSDESIPDGLRYSFTVYSIYQDQQDHIWIGTDRGINIFNPYKERFRTIRHQDRNEASLPKNDINEVFETAQGDILVGTWGGGITVFDQQWNFKRNIQFGKEDMLDQVWSFVQQDDGTIWAGCQRGFLHIINPHTYQVKTIQPPEVMKSTILVMQKDSEGNVFMGLNNGKICTYDKAANVFYSIDEMPDSIRSTLSPVNNILPDNQNRIWVTTKKNLLEYDIRRRTYTGQYELKKKETETGNTYLGIVQLNDTVLLIGTEFSGLQQFNTKTKQFSHYLDDPALEKTTINAIRKDRANQIWFTTNFDLYKITPYKKTIRYDLDATILRNALGSPRFFEMKNGDWVTTSYAEIIVFNPAALNAENDQVLKVEISSFRVFDEYIPIDSFIESKAPVTLAYNRNFFTIEFSALNFTDARRTNFYYRLRDVDKDWISSDTKAFADYTDIKPGEYVFEVKASYGNGDSPITSIPIIITPPWWATSWFRILSFCLLCAVIYLAVRKRIQAIHKESAFKQRIAETEMMALRSQMNPHFIFNCINSIDAMIQSNDKYRATVYLNKFAKLIRNVLDTSNQNTVPLYKDMETLQLYIDLEMFRYQGKFKSTLYTDEELLQNDYKVPPLIVQPYVENAIHHGLRNRGGQDGILSIRVTKESDHLLYIVEDNGTGRKALNGHVDRKEKGYGMQMSSDRVRLFNNEKVASVKVTDMEEAGTPAGTRVEVRLKIQ